MRPTARRKKQAYHHRDLRKALVAAALDALPEVGAAGLSLRDIARRAGVSPAAPYHHFQDKDALLAVVAGECAQHLLDALEGATAQAGDDQRRRFQLTGIAFVRFAVLHPAHFRALELPDMLAKIPKEIRRRFDAFYAEEGRRMREAQRAGLIAPLPFERLILAATALVHGLAHMIINGATDARPGDVAHAERLARDVTAIFGAGVLPRDR
ncbi:MAG: TetR/AcrR family transcriptional regulator [Polyangia bacterium]